MSVSEGPFLLQWMKQSTLDSSSCSERLIQHLGELQSSSTQGYFFSFFLLVSPGFHLHNVMTETTNTNTDGSVI